jgi:hypothetical protein
MAQLSAPSQLPNIVRLTGITVDECQGIYKPQQDHIELTTDDTSSIVESGYEDYQFETEKIPKTFTSVSKWTIPTTIRCWYCSRNLVDAAFFVPVYITATSDTTLEMGVEGMMCTIGCVKSYVDITYFNREEKENIEKLLKIEMFLMTGRHVKQIIPAINTHLQTVYGGRMGVKEYNDRMSALNKPTTIETVVPENLRASTYILSNKAHTVIVKPNSEWSKHRS